MHSDLELSCMCVDALVDALVVRVDEVLLAAANAAEPARLREPHYRTGTTSSNSERTSCSSNRT
jgi:hypothetical protein